LFDLDLSTLFSNWLDLIPNTLHIRFVVKKSMLKIHGFDIQETLHEGASSIVYRAYRNSDKSPVIIKYVKESPHGVDLHLKLQHEFDLSSRVHHINVATPLSIEQYEQRPVLVFSDTKSHSLLQYLRSNKISVEEFLTIAIAITNGLDAIHQQQIIHRDINPSNIIYNPQTKELKIIDFSISTNFSQPSAEIITSPETTNHDIPTDSLQKNKLGIGSLPYISPEQTGRTNRQVDYRTDYYSLGVTLYQLYSAKLPFDATEPLDMINNHIAKMPTPLSELTPDVPQVISDIVSRLMEKDEEDRYLSCHGLIADLTHCQKSLNEGSIIPFVLGTEDIPADFKLPSRIYGREFELASLLEGFDEICAGGMNCCFISGYSGVGKSTLINELLKPVALKNGYFVSGKFDQFQRDVPYSAFIQCFKKLIKQIQSESDEQVEYWKETLSEAAGVNGQIIIDAVPEVEALIGPQKTTPISSAVATKNRVDFTLMKFIRLFCSKEHPLVLFLDDLEWIDLASLNLIEQLLMESSINHLFIIGAYRTNQVDDSHPLSRAFRTFESNKVEFQIVELKPLTQKSVEIQIADALHSFPEHTRPLAELIFSKTQGNPFFTLELLKSLYEDKVIYYSPKDRKLSWDIDRISKLNISDNVLELMEKKITVFSSEQLSVLKEAACIGTVVELSTLALLINKSIDHTAELLLGPVNQGVLTVTGDATISMVYSFSHDRIHQAIYDKLSEHEKQQQHLKTARFLKSFFNNNERRLFEIVHHYNQSSDLITDTNEKAEAAIMNLAAAKKAKRSAAFSAAFHYAEQGIKLFGWDAWNTHYSETMDLYTTAVDAAYLSNHEADMQVLVLIAIKHAKCKTDIVSIYKSQLMNDISNDRLHTALERAITIINDLAKLSKNPNIIPMKSSLIRASIASMQLVWKLRNVTLEDLEALPPCEDPVVIAQTEIAVIAGWIALWTDPHLLPVMLKTGMNTLFKYGYCKNSPFILASYCIILNAVAEKYEKSNGLSKLAIKLLDKWSVPEERPATEAIVTIFVSSWHKHIKESLQPLLKIHVEAREYGGHSFC